MSNKSRVNTRKGQLIHTFGPGAMQINKDGISMITCGLDHWFECDESTEPLDRNTIRKFERNDERLKNKLDVKSFRIPPDFKVVEDGTIKNIPIPAKRFPLWHICSNTKCQLLLKGANEANDEKEKVCPKCGAPAYQSRFISMCEDGHIDDFPWFDWLNHYTGKNCSEETCQLRLEGTGSSSVSNIRVKCISCNTKSISLKGIFQSETTAEGKLVSTLSKAGITCSGNAPWVNKKCECGNSPVAALRQATNVYFSKTDSSIHIPSGTSSIHEKIAEAFEDLTDQQKSVVNGSGDIDMQCQLLDMAFSGSFSSSAIKSYLIEKNKGDSLVYENEEQYRYQERSFFIKDVREDTLSVKSQSLSDYQSWLQDYFSNISLINKLTVTQAFYGFDRFMPRTKKTIQDYKTALWASGDSLDSWLPAVQNYGEGIYIEFDSEKITEWAHKYSKLKSFQGLIQKKESLSYLDRFESITPEFFLIHSFSHLLINKLVYECGYSSASLRERLYVSSNGDTNMYGVLIYTASGDSEGSLGGLVRMGQPGKLEVIIKKAINDAQWCSLDPICYESGHSGGQGPNGLNLAACHNCLLLPETSCEAFNSFLDRTAIIGVVSDHVGYFDNLRN
ncbi:DUF1998 domain-containing protein [Vibrio fluvialis]|nr:DUF1998 domain-containing protein [Vibrio fluvialis]